jgi:hypothetical protein
MKKIIVLTSLGIYSPSVPSLRIPPPMPLPHFPSPSRWTPAPNLGVTEAHLAHVRRGRAELRHHEGRQESCSCRARRELRPERHVLPRPQPALRAATALRRSSGAAPACLHGGRRRQAGVLLDHHVDRIFDTYLAREACGPTRKIGFMPEALSMHPEPYQHEWRPGLRALAGIGTGWSYPPKDYQPSGASWSING